MQPVPRLLSVCLALLGASLPTAWRAQAATDAPALTVVCPAKAPPRLTLAARELCRYAYLRTGVLPDIADATPAHGDAMVLRPDPALERDAYRLKTTRDGGRVVLTISGGSDLGGLYGAYRVAEILGVRFHLHGDTLPDGRLALSLPDLDETHTPLFDTRGIQPFHDFTEGPDWWTLDDYKAHLAQMTKMRMNLLGLHCYPEGGVGPEPLVWIGLPGDVHPDGTVAFSYPSRWASTRGGAWGYGSTQTRQFAAGAGWLFPDDDYGSPVTDGFRPWPQTDKDANALFNRAGRFFQDAFGFGRALGIRTCVGTETPLRIPNVVVQRLQQKGSDPKTPATVRALYAGMFQRLARTASPDYYWLWTPEDWTWGGNRPGQLEATLADLNAALGALEDAGRPFTLATCGWVLGPRQDRAALDTHLPKTSPLSCINRNTGFAFVEPAFARIRNRPKWAIPWMEDDPNMVGVQLWAGRTRRDAADAHAYGCTGLLGIHWRTRILAPNFAALAQSSWTQKPWNPDFGRRIEVPASPPLVNVRLGGSTAAYLDNPIAGTDLDPIYQTCAWGLDGYRLKIPNGTYDVTLQLCEVHYDQKAKRVFGVNLQNRTVIEHLDVFGRVGKNVALDLAFPAIKVDRETLAVDFIPEIEFPFLAGLILTRADGAEPSSAKPYTRKINCGAGAWRDYEADLPAPADVHPSPGRARDLPCNDLYADWARAEFGPEAGGGLAAIFTRLDGGPGDYSGNAALTRLPRPSDWLAGPGGIRPNATPWDQEKARYAFVDEIAALRPRVRGAASLDRFDYWLHAFEYHRALGQLGCTRGALDAIMRRIAKQSDPAVRKRLAVEDALPVRLALARQWEAMMTHLLQTVSTPGELGTIANLEQHTLRNPNHPRFLDLHDARLAEWSGAPLPANAQPAGSYQGPPRIIVPTVRSVARAGESLALTVIVLANTRPREATLHWRRLGGGEYRRSDLAHVARGVHAAVLPAATDDTLEYYLRVQLPEGPALHWPATAPGQGQTVVTLPAGDVP
ncbi:MAG: hypothetical protein JXQ71_08280 [Verrucomicrobia bacterium]|nr:hypothetical protein [Verrucomicrobiota bacterium]